MSVSEARPLALTGLLAAGWFLDYLEVCSDVAGERSRMDMWGLRCAFSECERRKIASQGQMQEMNEQHVHEFGKPVTPGQKIGLQFDLETSQQHVWMMAS